MKGFINIQDHFFIISCFLLTRSIKRVEQFTASTCLYIYIRWSRSISKHNSNIFSSIYPSFYPALYSSTYPSFYPALYSSTYPSFYPALYSSHLTILLSILLSIHLSIQPFIYLQ